MTDWRHHHRRAGRLAGEAENAEKSGDVERAKDLYRQAADEMSLSFLTLPGDQAHRSSAVTTVVDLHLKAGDLKKVEELACKWIPSPQLDDRAKDKLRKILSEMWSVEILKVERGEELEGPGR